MRAVLFLLLLSSFVGCRRALAPTTAPTRPQSDKPAPSLGSSSPVTVAPSIAIPETIMAPGANRLTWTHKELAEHLRSKGLKVVVESVPQYSTDGKVAAGFYEESPSGTTLSMALVYACRDTKAAADQAGALGDGAVTFGRFAIGLFPKPDDKKADLDFLRRISKALN